ncbi:AacA7 [Schleiferilactobacillus shenzhenensis LY-73]|uniref:Aminoglycoside N(6')-acetyltransferase type 1 n=2 Tax=Schleiferilactobacillus shenzhenensis TaxID=1231337 RepID=U4TM97_9LACO|nr:AacA7 [Schleiferilactobacillus shenzhenensis LY-73]
MTVTKSNVRQVADLQHALWPEHPLLDLIVAAQTAVQAAKSHYWLAMDGQKAVGFCEVTLRRDYVEGSDTSPTGYLEGIYVLPDYRRQGIGTELVNAAAHWLRTQRVSAMGSDVALDNTVSQAFHEALGFEETARLVHYLRKN